LGEGAGSGDGDGCGEGCGPGPGLGSMPGGGSPPPNVMDPPVIGKSRIGSKPPLPPPLPSSLAAAVVDASSPCPSPCGSIAMYGTPSLSTTVNASPRSAGVLLSPLTARSPVRRISPAITAARPRTKRRHSAILQRVIPNLASNTTYAPDAVRTRLYRRPSLRTLELKGLGRKASTSLRYLLAPPSRLQQSLYAFGAIRGSAGTRSRNSCRTLFPLHGSGLRWVRGEGAILSRTRTTIGPKAPLGSGDAGGSLDWFARSDPSSARA
jgi:hypothetical protein